MKDIKKNKEDYVLNSSRAEYYLDFTINLTHNVIDYYVDSVKSLNNIKNHFNWCYDKTCDDYFLEGVYFYDNKKLKDYYYNYFYNQFYSVIDNKKYNTTIDYHLNFWKNIFNLKENTTNIKIKVVTEIYNIFNDTINNKKKFVMI